jgi:hypothetical protein
MFKTLFKDILEGDLTPPELHELKELGVGSKLALALGDNAPEKMYSTLVNYYEVKETECPLCGKPLREGHSGTKMCFYCKTNIAPKMDKEVFIFTPDRELLAIFLENLTGDDYSLAEEEVEGYDESDTDYDDSDPYSRETCPHAKRDAFEELGDIVKTMAKEIGSLKRELESMKNKLLQSPKAKPHDTAKAELLKHLKDLTKLLGE